MDTLVLRSCGCEEFGRVDFVGRERVAVRRRFSAPGKPIRTVQAERLPRCRRSRRCSVFSCVSSAALPLAPFVLPVSPSTSCPCPLPFLPNPHPLPPALCCSAALQISSIIPRYYSLAEGESVSDCNLDCPIVSCCSVAKLKKMLY